MLQMLRTNELPTKIVYNDTKCRLTVCYKNGTVMFKPVSPHRPDLPLQTVKTIKSVPPNTYFNVVGVDGATFYNGEFIEQETPYTFSNSENLVKLRPYLKDGRCMYGERQGSYGHYSRMGDGIAAPLT